MSDVSESLTKNERPWAICSGRSEEMSDCERIAQVTYQKWANELIARFFERIAHFLPENERFARKTDEQIPSPGSAWLSQFLMLVILFLYSSTAGIVNMQLFMWVISSLFILFLLFHDSKTYTSFNFHTFFIYIF